jgi:site-specific recombinase XerD
MQLGGMICKAGMNVIIHFWGDVMRKPQKSVSFLTPDELLRVLGTARTHSTRDWCALLLTYSHGLRAQETCNLKLSDVDQKGGQVSIQRLKGSLHTVQQLMPHRGQSLLDEVKALRQYLAERPSDAGDALFISQKGGALSSTQLYRIYRGYAQEVGLPVSKCHPHCLKHSLACHLVSQNVNLARVKQYLGHSSIGSTMRYVSVSDQEASQDAQNALMNAF